MGGIGGLLVDGAFFGFLIVISTIMTMVGFFAVILAYLFYPILALLSTGKNSKKKSVDGSILLDDGPPGTRPLVEMVKSEATITTKR
jgi:hypothetical protein